MRKIFIFKFSAIHQDWDWSGSWSPPSWKIRPGFSSTLSCDFRPLTMISDDLRLTSDVFVKLSLEKNIVEEIELIMGAHADRSSPSWVCIQQKSLPIARDFWNTNSLGWTPFHMGACDGFSVSHMVSESRASAAMVTYEWTGAGALFQ